EMTAAAETTGTPAAEPNSPEALLREITVLKARPIEVANAEQAAAAANEAPAIERERLHQIITLATEAIAKTHSDPQKEQLFNNAVHYLTDSRVQLALAGDAQQAQSLADDAEALFQRDSTSFAAVQSGYKVVELAQKTAERFGGRNIEWVQAYSQQARLFAAKFPQEEGRAAVALISAGRLCEGAGLIDEARRCYGTVQDRYPDSPFSEQIAGIQRRLNLPGEVLELGGTTIDGGFISVKDFRGRAVLVAFWASNSSQFASDVPHLQQLEAKYGTDRLTVIGVNMDTDETAVDSFLEKTGIGWRQIFFASPEQRGTRNPVAAYYGINQVPVYWLVDTEGVVAACPLSLDQADARIAEILEQN
ncbi:MAG: TlpA family protein disulfide reductase, partial [Maioricimonas sp. JB049]